MTYSGWDEPEPPFTENEYQRMAEEIAQGEWDDCTDRRWEWVREEIHHYAEQLLAGGEMYAAACKRMEQDFVAYRAAMLDEADVYDALRGEGVTQQERAAA